MRLFFYSNFAIYKKIHRYILIKTTNFKYMNKSSLTFPLLLCLLIGLILCSLSWGRFAIPIENVIQSLIGNNANDVQNNIIFNLRLPRVIAAILVGASLAIAGVVYQGIFRNPLVSPDILGVSNGACVGAALAILIWLGDAGHSGLCLYRWFDCRLAHHEFTASKFGATPPLF